MTILTTYEQIDPRQWDALVDNSPVASWFQAREAYRFFESLGFTEPFVVAVCEGNALVGLTVGYLQGDGGWLKQKLSRRAIIVGGPLLSYDISDTQLSAMLRTLRDSLRRHCIYIETRNLNDYSQWKGTFEACGFQYVAHNNFHIDTTSADMVDKRMDKSRRRRIRRATEAGASISDDLARLPDFYQILSDLYKHKVHKPLPPIDMFQSAARIPSAKYFFVVSPEGKTIGGQLILVLGQRVAYAWYCCGLDHEYHDLYPSIMANYAAIRYAAENGFERFDMMGAGSPGKDYGVRDFKAQFGGTLVEHGRFRRVNMPLIYNAASAFLALREKVSPK